MDACYPPILALFWSLGLQLADDAVTRDGWQTQHREGEGVQLPTQTGRGSARKSLCPSRRVTDTRVHAGRVGTVCQKSYNRFSGEHKRATDTVSA
jgi:hypothetical protein